MVGSIKLLSNFSPLKDLLEDIPNDALLPSYLESDIWTTNDNLNYKLYAIAIANFLTKPETKPPLSICIQAPWGGGKSSLMRMIQEQLDEKGAALAKQRIDFRTSTNVKLKDIKKWAWSKLFKKYRFKDSKKMESVKIPSFESKGFKIAPKVTVWFNAWKYESTEQVWAGLADSIVREISSRLNPVEREWFFLELNLRRTDFNSIRRWVYEKSLIYLWGKIRIWLKPSILILGGFVISYILSWTNFNDFFNHNSNADNIKNLLGNSGIYGIIGSIGFIIFNFFKEKNSTDNEPSEVSLGKYVSVPDYNDKLGFIHHVSEDLQIIFKTIPQQYLPIIIFVDDLDRCSPNHVAEVIEGINLFLAGDFRDCIFLLGWIQKW